MSDTELVKSVVADILSCLEVRKRQLFDEIRAYPTPIAGCDQQFNYLLEQLARVTEELESVTQLVDTLATQQEPIELLSSTIGRLTSVEAEARQSLLARLR